MNEEKNMTDQHPIDAAASEQVDNDIVERNETTEITEEKKKSKKGFIFFLIALLAVIGIVFAMSSGNKEPNEMDQPSVLVLKDDKDLFTLLEGDALPTDVMLFLDKEKSSEDIVAAAKENAEIVIDYTDEVKGENDNYLKAGSYSAKVVVGDVEQSFTLTIKAKEDKTPDTDADKKDDEETEVNDDDVVANQPQQPSSKPSINTSNSSNSNTSSKPSNSVSNSKPSETPKPAPAPTPSTPSTPAHTHNWVTNTTTVEHSEEGHYEQQLVKEAWTEDIPKYRDSERCICNGCGLDITGWEGKHMKERVLAGYYECGGYHTEWHSIMDGYQTIDHPAEYQDVWVVDKAAWIETITTSSCSCGATK